ncbi:putative DNA helicase [Helianthus annuus]|nr:putative DNA helicase [Helianthus annuus]
MVAQRIFWKSFSTLSWSFKMFKVSVAMILLVMGMFILDEIKRLLDKQEKLYEKQSELKAVIESYQGLEQAEKDHAAPQTENWSGAFEWDNEADDIRLNIFGIPTYRANQREVGRFFLLVVNIDKLPICYVAIATKYRPLFHVKQ